jgi:hypothetical protein
LVATPHVSPPSDSQPSDQNQRIEYEDTHRRILVLEHILGRIRLYPQRLELPLRFRNLMMQVVLAPDLGRDPARNLFSPLGSLACPTRLVLSRFPNKRFPRALSSTRDSLRTRLGSGSGSRSASGSGLIGRTCESIALERVSCAPTGVDGTDLPGDLDRDMAFGM